LVGVTLFVGEVKLDGPAVREVSGNAGEGEAADFG
jgi:hypothetical protein